MKLIYRVLQQIANGLANAGRNIFVCEASGKTTLTQKAANVLQRKKPLPDESGFYEISWKEVLLDFWQRQHLAYLNVVGVGADGGFVGVVDLVPLGGVTVVVFGNFGEGVSAYHRIGFAGSSFRLSSVAKEVGTASSRLCSGFNWLFFAFVREKIKQSHGRAL